MRVFSSGFDASEYETEDMSRHGHHVPTSFYHRFTRDACKFAQRYSRGRIISVLEGGYSDKALISGAFAHVTGLADVRGLTEQGWWNLKALDEVRRFDMSCIRPYLCDSLSYVIYDGHSYSISFIA